MPTTLYDGISTVTPRHADPSHQACAHSPDGLR